MPQKAKVSSTVNSRYERSQLKQGPRASTVMGDKAQGKSNKGTEVKFDYGKKDVR